MKHNLGFAAANNLAARQAPEVEWVTLLNSDAFPEPDWLEHNYCQPRLYPDCAAFGIRHSAFGARLSASRWVIGTVADDELGPGGT